MSEQEPVIIEEAGRLLVLQPHLVQIQSPEGQRYLRERHGAVMEHMRGYSVLRRNLFTDEWAQRHLQKWLSDSRTLASVCRPHFYMEEWELKSGLWPRLSWGAENQPVKGA